MNQLMVKYLPDLSKTAPSSWQSSPYSGYDFTPHTPKPQDYSALFDSSVKEQPVQVPERESLILQGKYIITPSKSGLMAINIRRAMERIMYEKFLKALSESRPVTQTALFPVQVQVGPAGRAILDEYAQTLSAVGFEITPFGKDTIVVSGVPEGCSEDTDTVNTMVNDLLIILSDEGGAALPDLMRSSMAEKLAMMAASGSIQTTTNEQAQTLIESLLQCENPETTSTGRKTMTILTVEDLDKKF